MTGPTGGVRTYEERPYISPGRKEPSVAQRLRVFADGAVEHYCTFCKRVFPTPMSFPGHWKLEDHPSIGSMPTDESVSTGEIEVVVPAPSETDAERTAVLTPLRKPPPEPMWAVSEPVGAALAKLTAAILVENHGSQSTTHAAEIAKLQGYVNDGNTKLRNARGEIGRLKAVLANVEKQRDTAQAKLDNIRKGLE